MLPLLDKPSTLHLGLRTLTTVTHHGGSEARKEIARYSPKLVLLMKQYPDDPKVLELATVTLAHSSGAVAGGENKPDAKLLKEIDIPGVLKITLDNLQKPSASYYMMNHALGLVTSTTLRCHKECKATPPLLPYLVANLRSTDLTTRCNALGGLIRLTLAESEPDILFYDPNKLIAAVKRRFPDDLMDAIGDYGMTSCDTMVIARTMAEFQRAMMNCAQDHDLAGLGRTVATLIQRTEFAVAEGGFQAMNERTGRLELMDIGLPFKMWTDALPMCARKGRGRGCGRGGHPGHQVRDHQAAHPGRDRVREEGAHAQPGACVRVLRGRAGDRQRGGAALGEEGAQVQADHAVRAALHALARG